MRKVSLTLFVLLGCMTLCAEDFMVDGIAYNILSISDRTVEMTCPAATWTRVEYKNIAYPNKHVFNIPEEVTYKGITWKVVRIGTDTFAQTYIEKLSIPMSVKSIGDAFWLTSGDIKMDLSKTGVEEIEACTFHSGSGSSCFTEIIIPNTVSCSTKAIVISDQKVKNIVYPDNYEDFHALNATQCYNLEHITLPYHINHLDEPIASQCNKLTEIILNNIDTFTVGDCLAYACTNLNRVYLGKTKLILSENAIQGGELSPLFWECPNLKELIMDCDDPEDFTIEDLFSKGQYVYTTLWVPEGCAEVYRSKEGWKNFFNIMEGRPDNARCIIHTEESEDGSLEQTNTTEWASENVDYVKVNGSASFIIAPYEGKDVESVTVNGVDMTDQLTSPTAEVKAKRMKKAPAKKQYMLKVDNIKRNIDVKVKYKNDEASALKVEEISQPTVVAGEGSIIVKQAKPGSKIEIYDIAGCLIATAQAGSDDTIIPIKQKQVYLVKANGYSNKIKI